MNTFTNKNTNIKEFVINSDLLKTFQDTWFKNSNNKFSIIANLTRMFDKSHLDNKRIHLLSSITGALDLNINYLDLNNIITKYLKLKDNNYKVYYIFNIITLQEYIDLLSFIDNKKYNIQDPSLWKENKCVKINYSDNLSIYYIPLNNLFYILNSEIQGIDTNNIFTNLFGDFYLKNNDYRSINSQSIFIFRDIIWSTVLLYAKLNKIDISGGCISRRHILNTVNYDLMEFLYLIENKNINLRKHIVNNMFNSKFLSNKIDTNIFKKLKDIINIISKKDNTNWDFIQNETKKIMNFIELKDNNGYFLYPDLLQFLHGFLPIFILEAKLSIINNIEDNWLNSIKNILNKIKCLKIEIQNYSDFHNKDIIIKLDIIDNITKFKITFVDSLNILNNGLRNLTKDFKVNYMKTDFPYTFVNKERLNYCGITPPLEYFSNLSYIEYSKILSYNWDLRLESLNYLINDLKCLFVVLSKFKKDFFEDHAIEMTEGLTISRLALTKYLKYYLKDHQIPLINDSSMFNFICSALQLLYRSLYSLCWNLHYLDYKSLNYVTNFRYFLNWI